ncbi:ParB/RepB/Spo0J family partition protein [Clostridium paridis]|uniref:ParB/Sulfiredoxin domain-containing protein n=1 Tax=Clostridium paridis TaxID=2803863 RepID=A0A937FIY0_9CLOT|nr:ParB N-terminal domain-containing protein [Clostridium paridis]MBL4933212.1 hypothetical protein [Clostridium paridis]
MSEKLTIGKKEYVILEKEIRQSDLRFYPENPRVYSILNVSDGIPEQDEIEEIITNMEHVKQLKLSIEANGGLIDPLIVRDGDNVVLEGNSRLAAYRLLARKDPTKWGKVKCKILPGDISESAIFTLLGQYHIIGRKDWSPFEQAGYLYRRLKSSEVPIEYIAQELGITESSAKNYIKVYSFMVDNGDLRSEHWSYYDEYLKNMSIKKYRETNANLDSKIVEEVKKGNIAQAADIRNKLGGIAKVTGKTANRIMAEISEGKIDIYTGFERIEDTGKTGNIYQMLYKFRNKINENDFRNKIKYEDQKQVHFELSKIKKAIEKLLNELDKK